MCWLPCVTFHWGRAGKAAPASPVDGPDLALLSLKKIIPASLDKTGGGSGKSIAADTFLSELQRQAFIASAYMVLQGNEKFTIRPYEIKLSYPHAEGRAGFHGALRAVDKDQKVVRAVRSEDFGQTHEMAFAALVDTIERRARDMLSRSDVAVGGRRVLRSVLEETRVARKPEVVKSPWTPSGPPRLHPNVSLVRDGVVSDPRRPDPAHIRSDERQYPPPGHIPTIKRNSSADRYLRSPGIDPLSGTHNTTAAAAFGERRLRKLERHSSMDPLGHPMSDRHSAERRLELAEARRLHSKSRHSSMDPLGHPRSNRYSAERRLELAEARRLHSKSMGNMYDTREERELPLLEQVDLKKAVLLGDIYPMARKMYPTSGHHQLYYEDDKNGPPIRHPVPVRDPGVITFQGTRRWKDRTHMTGLPLQGSIHGPRPAKSSEMVQRPHFSMEGSYGSAVMSPQTDDTQARLARGIRKHRSGPMVSSAHPTNHPDTTANAVRSAAVSTEPECYQGRGFASSSSSALPSRYHHRNSGAVTAKRPIVSPQPLYQRSVEAVVARASLVSSTSGSKDHRVMDSGSPLVTPQPGSDRSIDFLLSDSPVSVAAITPRCVRSASPSSVEFMELRPLKCVRKTSRPEEQAEAAGPSMESSSSHERDTASLMAGDTARPLVRLPTVGNHRPAGCRPVTEPTETGNSYEEPC